MTGIELAEALEKVGYRTTRQTGSHIRLTVLHPSEHHVTIPAHDPLKVGTLAAILGDVAVHLGFTRNQLLNRIFS